MKDAAIIAAGHRVLRVPVSWLRAAPTEVLAELIGIRRAAELSRA